MASGGHDPLERTKRTVYVVACLVGAPADALGWKLSDDPAIAVAYGLTALALLACAGLAASPLPLARAERIAFALVVSTFLGRFAVVVFLADGLAGEFGELLTSLVMICCVYLLAYLFLPRRPALLANLAVLVAAALVLGVGLATQGADGLPHGGMPLIKSTVMHPVFVVLLYILAATKDQMSRSRARAQVMAAIAATDPLTDLPNRRHLTETLERHVADWRRTGRAVSVVLLDIDRFKTINDSHGHSAGDAVLCHVAEVLRDEVRAADTIGRWGGEEFLIVAPDSDLEAAVQLAARCRARLHADPAPDVGLVTASFGVATTSEGRDVDAVLRAADQALYQAKDAGRDRVVAEPTREAV